jgi:hypothetical protein
LLLACAFKKRQGTVSQANNARTFISQLFTAGIAQEWIIRPVAHASRRTIDERYVNCIREAATGMAQFVSGRLGGTKHCVQKWSQI